MAMENKRIIQLNTERTTPTSGDYVMVDSATDGTAKYQLSKITDGLTQEIATRTAADTAINTEVTQLKEDLRYSNDGLETFGIYANFKIGTTETGVYNKWYTFRVTTEDLLTFDRDLDVTAKSGYRFFISIFVNGSYTSETLFTTRYTITKNTSFKITIGRDPEDSSIPADVSEFVNAITFRTKEYNRTEDIDVIRKNVQFVSEQEKPLYTLLNKNSYSITETKNLKATIETSATWQNSTYLTFNGLSVSSGQKLTILVDGRTTDGVSATNSYGICAFKDGNGTVLKTEYITFNTVGVDISDGSCDITYTAPSGTTQADVTIYGVSNYTPTIGDTLCIYGACVVIGSVELQPISSLSLKSDSLMLAEVSTMLKNQKEKDLSGVFYGGISQDYTAQTSSENWQTKSYAYINDVSINGYKYAYAIIMSRHGLGLRSGIITWYDSNNSALSSDWITSLETYDGGACISEFVIPTGATKLTAEFDGISNAQTAGETSVIGEVYYVRGCYIYLTNGKIDVDSDGDSLDSEWTDAASTIRAEQGTSLCFGIQTDTHFFTGAPSYVGKQLKDITKYVGFDFVANLGDITRGYTGDLHDDSPTNMRMYAETIMKRYTDGIRCPFITCIGNHEKNHMFADDHDGVDPFTLSELYAQFTKQTLNTSDKFKAPRGKSYYFIDLNGVRVIALFTNDSALGSFTVSDEQVEWFTNIALDTELPVLLLAHVPLVDGWNPDNLNYSNDYEKIMTPLEEFKNNGGTVIACIYGHAHRQEAQKKNGIWHIICTRTEVNYTTAEFFMVDLDTYNIETIGVGAATSRTFEH